MLLNLKWRIKTFDIQEFRVYICKKHEGEEDFINKKHNEICSHEKLSAEEVIYFLVSFSTVYVFSLAFYQ